MNEESIPCIRVYFSTPAGVKFADIWPGVDVERRPDGDWQVRDDGYLIVGIFERSKFIGWHKLPDRQPAPPAADAEPEKVEA